MLVVDLDYRGKSSQGFSGFKSQDRKNWPSVPIRLFVPEFDDYDDWDAKTGENFITKIPDEPDRSSFSAKLYPGATHGWEHGKAYSFHTAAACKVRGCVNTNHSNPAVK